jgi:hypothetical protein
MERQQSILPLSLWAFMVFAKKRNEIIAKHEVSYHDDVSSNVIFSKRRFLAKLLPV